MASFSVVWNANLMKGFCEEQLPLVWSKRGAIGVTGSLPGLLTHSLRPPRAMELKPAVLLLDRSALPDRRKNVTHVHHGSHSSLPGALSCSRQPLQSLQPPARPHRSLSPTLKGSESGWVTRGTEKRGR